LPDPYIPNPYHLLAETRQLLNELLKKQEAIAFFLHLIFPKKENSGGGYCQKHRYPIK
jgi:hypothetical protein